jgi:hypothetical protein
VRFKSVASMRLTTFARQMVVNRKSAFRQLRTAAADGEVRIIYADDADGPLPATREFWSNVTIQSSTGSILYDQSPDDVRKAALDNGVIYFRPILVHRGDLEKTWPVAPQTSLGSNIQLELPIRRPAAESDIVRAARELYQQSGKPPNQMVAEQLLMAKLPGTSRDKFIRPILQRKEFQALRLKPGNQRKR